MPQPHTYLRCLLGFLRSQKSEFGVFWSEKRATPFRFSSSTLACQSLRPSFTYDSFYGDPILVRRKDCKKVERERFVGVGLGVAFGKKEEQPKQHWTFLACKN